MSNALLRPLHESVRAAGGETYAVFCVEVAQMQAVVALVVEQRRVLLLHTLRLQYSEEIWTCRRVIVELKMQKTEAY